MWGIGNRCHVEIIDHEGYSEPCHKPRAGTITNRDDYGRKDIYPVCEEHMTAAMEGVDDAQ